MAQPIETRRAPAGGDGRKARAVLHGGSSVRGRAVKRAGVAAAVAGLLMAAWTVVASASAPPTATAFSFSGTLAQPNGNYDFQYQAYDAPTSGTLVAGPVIVGNVKVTSSKYSTTIDFGSNPFAGDARYLQVAWRKTGTTTFTTLTPRVSLFATPYALGLRLPVSESTSIGSNAFAVTNNGAGAALAGMAGSSGYGVAGSSVSGFAGLYGTSDQNGVFGDTSNASASGVYGHNSSSGAGVAGISQSGGYGVVGFGSSTSFAGVFGTSGVNGVYGDTSSANSSGVYGHDSSTGNGVAGISDGGIGGYFRGGGGSNPAIKLENGGIEVSGAGTDTATPVFTHQVTGSNTCDTGIWTVLDNPFLNGNPNAFVFLQSPYGDTTLRASYVAGSFHDCPTGQWIVDYWNSGSQQTWVSGDQFYVLVIDP